jgi:hypothetical protein
MIRFLTHVNLGDAFVCPTHKLSFLDCDPIQLLLLSRVFVTGFDELQHAACRILGALFVRAILYACADVTRSSSSADASPCFPLLVSASC